MASLNRAELIGALADNPELRFTPSGRPVAFFTLDVETEQLLDLKAPQTVMHSFPILVWGELGKLCNKFLRKGSWVYVQGGLVTERTKTRTTIHDEEFGDYDEDEIKYFARLIARKIEFFENNSANEAEALLAELENGANAEDRIVLPLTRLEARVIWYSIINGLEKITVLEEGEKEELKGLADNIASKPDPIASQGNVVLHATDGALTNINSFPHILQSDSECAYVYSSVGADGLIGNTGVRLSQLARHVPTMVELIETTDGLLDAT